MLVYLFRHGIAEPAETGQADFDRPLSPKGVARTQRAAAGLAKLLDAPPSRLLTSPKLRAVQTADILAEHLAKPPVVLDALMHPDPDAVNQALFAQPAGSAVLVGHEPMLSDWATAWLLGVDGRGSDVESVEESSEQADVESVAAAAKPAAACCVEIKKAGCLLLNLTQADRRVHGQLLWHLPPSVLRLVGK